MHEIQIQAQFEVLVEQRNAALNQVVNLRGELAVAAAQIRKLTADLEAATSLVSEIAEEVKNA